MLDAKVRLAEHAIRDLEAAFRLAMTKPPKENRHKKQKREYYGGDSEVEESSEEEPDTEEFNGPEGKEEEVPKV